MRQLGLGFCSIGFFLFSNAVSYAQVFTNDAAAREKHFIYEVKQIDEFFERFNNDSSSFLREVYKSRHVKFKIDRTKLIKSLFNYDTKSWGDNVVDSFTSAAVKIKMPTKRDFYGENWYAEADCKFQYNSSVIDMPIVLRVFTDQFKRSRWMVVAIKSNALASEATLSPIITGEDNTKFISPVSHTTNFIELHKAFEDKANLADYFDKFFFDRTKSLEFYNAVLNDHIKFLYVKDVKYHFLQVEGWIFCVEYFRRQSLNSGWLINSLKKATADDKEEFKRLLLGE
jgi:hypothetical protein